jgi:hypothetical protein
VFTTVNGGASWNAVNNGLTNTNITELAIDPTSSQTLYAGTYDGGVFKSVNGGATWSVVNSGLTNLTVTSLAIDPSSSQAIFAGTYGGVFRSVNGGVTWSNSGLTNLQIWSLAIDPIGSHTVYAGTYGAGVFKGLYPTITGTPATSVVTGLVYSFTPTATDATSFSISNKPSWASFTTTTGALTGAPTSGDVGTYSNIIITAVNGTGVAALPAFSITVTLGANVTVTVAIVGTGSGSVNSTPNDPVNGVACDYPPLSGKCTSTQLAGSSFTLNATASGNSAFGGWSGACSGCGTSLACPVSFNVAKNCTATFTEILPARIGVAYYSTIYAAYAKATSGALIETQAVTFIGDLLLNRGINVKVKGGYDGDYKVNPIGMTVVQGKLIIGTGSLVADRLTIR